MAIDFQPRRLNFGFQALPNQKYFFRENSILSTLFIALSSIFPEGERQFVRSVRYFQNQVSEPELAQQVRAFIGQESHHGNTHEQLNHEIERQWNYPIQKFVYSQTKRQERMHRRFSKQNQLALTVALEHLTAILAHQIISDEKILESTFPEFSELFTWHAIEEIEHKGVAFDLFKEIGGSEKIRKRMLVLATVGLSLHLVELIIKMHIKDKHWPSLHEWRVAFRALFGSNGIIRKMWPHYKAFYRDDFHPWSHDNMYLIKGWQQRYPDIFSRVESSFVRADRS